MRILIVLVLVAAAAWSGYWVVGARTLEAELAEWFAARRAEGWVAETGAIEVAGFPNRFDATLRGVELADPATGLAWTAPRFQILALSYRPNEVIAAWPREQTIASPYQRVTVGSERFRASAAFAAGPALALRRTTVVVEALTLDSTGGWRAAVATGRFAIRRLAESETAYRIGAEAQGVRPGQALIDALDPPGRLPPVIETLRLDVTAEFDAPWDRFALEAARPQPVRLDLDELRARWGRLELRAAGTLEIGADGLPEGRVTVKATNWREILALAVRAGLVPDSLSGTLERALEVLAGLSGGAETLDVPLTFAGGRVSFGPVPLGRAPPLVLR